LIEYRYVWKVEFCINESVAVAGNISIGVFGCFQKEMLRKKINAYYFLNVVYKSYCIVGSSKNV